MIKYENMMLNKYIILQDNQGKAGVYRLINLINQKSYVGSSINLSNRLRNFYSNGFLTSKILKDNSRIYKSILKYNLSKFKLDILEYTDKKDITHRKQYYMDLFQPEYNILKKAGSSLGFKHSAKTLLKFKSRKTPPGYTTIALNMGNNTRKEYHSVRAAAKALNIHHNTLRLFIKNNKRVKGTYKVYTK